MQGKILCDYSECTIRYHFSISTTWYYHIKASFAQAKGRPSDIFLNQDTIQHTDIYKATTPPQSFTASQCMGEAVAQCSVAASILLKGPSKHIP